jgi:hypothetical protein
MVLLKAEVIGSFLDRKSCICTARERIHIEERAFRSLALWGFLWSFIPYSINGIFLHFIVMLIPEQLAFLDHLLLNILEFVQGIARLTDPVMAFLSLRWTFSATYLITYPHLCHVPLPFHLSDLFPFLPGRLDPYHLHGAHHLCHLGCSVAGFAVDPSPGQQSRLAPVDT